MWPEKETTMRTKTKDYPLAVGDRVKWTSYTYSLRTRTWTNGTEIGTIYRLLPVRVCVLPDSWAVEGKTTGVRLLPGEVTKI